jgi:protein-S-isoprenylcysteine O-methyltransferase Ste14
MSSLAIFVVGLLVLIGGLAYGASMAGVSPQWIAVGAIVMAGIGIVMGVTKTRTKDVSHS